MKELRATDDRAKREAFIPENVLDQWVARLETRPDERRAPRARAPRPLSTGAKAAPAIPATDLTRVRDALAKIEARGSSLVFQDAVGGTVVLGRSGERVAHAGTVAVRGPFGLSLGALRKHGLSEPQVRGIEYVAAWFGAPFDALSVHRSEGGSSLRWGFWPLGAPEVGRALACWKERWPASFEGMLGSYGFDVDPVSEQDLAGPALRIVDPVRGTQLCEGRALDAIARDPRRLALLARAGRHDDAKAAQLEVALRPVLPMFRMSVTRGDERAPLASIASSASTVAALVLSLRTLDLTRLGEILSRVSLGADGTEETKLVSILLEVLGERYPPTALAVRRALSSPELGA